MSKKDSSNIAQLLINLGKAIQNDSSIIPKLEEFLKENTKSTKSEEIDFEKINSLDLYALVKTKSEEEINSLMSEFSLKELKAISKKYHFGVPPRIRSAKKMKEHIFHQLQKRNVDVFINSPKEADEENKI